MNKYGIVYRSSTKLDFEGNTNHLVKINIGGEDKLYYVVSEKRTEEFENCQWYDMNYCSDMYIIWTYELSEFRMVKTKSNEQIAAEQSVTKAKEALKAAENALKIIKEQSK